MIPTGFRVILYGVAVIGSVALGVEVSWWLGGPLIFFFGGGLLMTLMEYYT